MTLVAILQAVEQGKLDLDRDVRPVPSPMGRYVLVAGFDDEARHEGPEAALTRVVHRALPPATGPGSGAVPQRLLCALAPCTRSSWHWASRTLSGRRGPLPVWCLDGQEAGGRFAKGTTFSAVVPSIEWFMDHETGICGTALCQILPPMHPAVIALHDKF